MNTMEARVPTGKCRPLATRRRSMLHAASVVLFLTNCGRPPIQSSAREKEQERDVAFPVLYLDMDGTLLGSDHKIRAESLKAIAEYRACGGRLGIASGRTIEQVRPYFTYLQPDLPLVLFNGAVTYSASGTAIIGRAGLNRDTLRRVVAVLSTAESGVLGVLAQYDDGRTLADRPARAVSEWAARSNVTVEGTCSFAECVVDPAEKGSIPPAKLLLLAEPSQVDSIQASIAHRLDPHARAIIGNAREGVIEILAPNTNKAAAISAVVTSNGLGSSSWAAIGDSQNDVEMVAAGGLGLAMGNCHPQTCKAADLILDHNDTDAIALAIRSQLLTRTCKYSHER